MVNVDRRHVTATMPGIEFMNLIFRGPGSGGLMFQPDETARLPPAKDRGDHVLVTISIEVGGAGIGDAAGPFQQKLRRLCGR